MLISRVRTTLFFLQKWHTFLNSKFWDIPIVMKQHTQNRVGYNYIQPELGQTISNQFACRLVHASLSPQWNCEADTRDTATHATLTPTSPWSDVFFHQNNQVMFGKASTCLFLEIWCRLHLVCLPEHPLGLSCSQRDLEIEGLAWRGNWRDCISEYDLKGFSVAPGCLK